MNSMSPDQITKANAELRDQSALDIVRWAVAQARGKPAEEMERLSRRGKKPEPVAAAAVADAPVEEPVG